MQGSLSLSLPHVQVISYGFINAEFCGEIKCCGKHGEDGFPSLPHDHRRGGLRICSAVLSVCTTLIVSLREIACEYWLWGLEAAARCCLFRSDNVTTHWAAAAWRTSGCTERRYLEKNMQHFTATVTTTTSATPAGRVPRRLAGSHFAQGAIFKVSTSLVSPHYLESVRSADQCQVSMCSNDRQRCVCLRVKALLQCRYRSLTPVWWICLNLDNSFVSFFGFWLRLLQFRVQIQWGLFSLL